MFTQTYTRPKLQSSVIKLLFAEDYNFEQITIPAGSQANGSTLFDIGTVLGQVTASGKYVQFAPGASDGSQNAAAVISRAATVSASADTPAAAAVRGPVVLDADNLVWPTGATAAQKAAALAQLAALGLVARSG